MPKGCPEALTWDMLWCCTGYLGIWGSRGRDTTPSDSGKSVACLTRSTNQLSPAEVTLRTCSDLQTDRPTRSRLHEHGGNPRFAGLLRAQGRQARVLGGGFELVIDLVTGLEGG